MTKTLSVTAIKKGTVIDHIPAGQAIPILRILKLSLNNNQMTVGLNLKSKTSGLKDLIKIENKKLTEKEAQDIAIFAPEATINIIDNFKVHQKIALNLPKSISGLLVCPNAICVTHNEPVDSLFYCQKSENSIKLRCKYCEKTFDRSEIREYST